MLGMPTRVGAKKGKKLEALAPIGETEEEKKEEKLVTQKAKPQAKPTHQIMVDRNAGTQKEVSLALPTRVRAKKPKANVEEKKERVV